MRRMRIGWSSFLMIVCLLGMVGMSGQALAASRDVGDTAAGNQDGQCVVTVIREFWQTEIRPDACALGWLMADDSIGHLPAFQVTYQGGAWGNGPLTDQAKQAVQAEFARYQSNFIVEHDRCPSAQPEMVIVGDPVMPWQEIGEIGNPLLFDLIHFVFLPHKFLACLLLVSL